MRFDDSLDPIVLAVVVGFLMALSVLGWRALAKAWHSFTLRRRWAHAAQAEARAPALLGELGYAVVGAQVQGSYTLELDGAPMNVPLRADYVVERAGLSFVAEVKSGKAAPRLTTAATRRQLLEYLLAFQVDGVLLVDGETRRVHEVVFPLSLRAKPAGPRGELWALLGAMVFAVLALYLLLGR